MGADPPENYGSWKTRFSRSFRNAPDSCPMNPLFFLINSIRPVCRPSFFSGRYLNLAVKPDIRDRQRRKNWVFLQAEWTGSCLAARRPLDTRIRELTDDTPKSFSDNHLLVAVKPRASCRRRNITGEPDMLTILKKYLVESKKQAGRGLSGLLHRWDRPVSGIMVFAKTSKCASRLSAQIRNAVSISGTEPSCAENLRAGGNSPRSF
jgi:hypothetical protein